MKKNKQQRLFRIAEVLGLKVKFEHAGDSDIEFSNRTICLDCSSNAPWGKYLLAHELGHYLVAAPSRRHRKNYGIPEYYTRRVSSSERSEHYWNLDDTKATLVGNALLRACGLKSSRLSYAGWILQSAKHWYKTTGQHMVAGLLLIK